MAVAWLRELEECDAERNAVCTGRFECRVGDEQLEGLPFEAALAWARERADRAYRPVRARLRVGVLEELEAATDRVPYEQGAVDVQGRWGAEVDVHPPGYEWRAPLL